MSTNHYIHPYILWIIGLLVLSGLSPAYAKPSVPYLLNDRWVSKSFCEVPKYQYVWEENEYPLVQEAVPIDPNRVRVYGGYVIQPAEEAQPIIPTGNSNGSSIEWIDRSHVPIDDFLAHETFYKLSVRIIHKEKGYVDFKLDPPVDLPLWARSMDFWTCGLSPSIDLVFFISFNHPNQKMVQKSKIQFNGKNPREWNRHYKEFFANHSIPNHQKIQLHRIRVQVTRGEEVPDYFELYVSQPKVHNVLKPSETRNLDLQYAYETMETFPKGWQVYTYQQHVLPDQEVWQEDYSKGHYQISSSLEPKTAYQLEPVEKSFWQIHPLENPDPSPHRYLALADATDILHNHPVVIEFSPGYRVYKGYLFSLKVLGTQDGAEILGIFQEGKNRYFEISMGRMNFSGWRNLYAALPEREIIFFHDQFADIEYIQLVGLRISLEDYMAPRFSIGLDEVGSTYDYRRLSMD